MSNTTTTTLTAADDDHPFTDLWLYAMFVGGGLGMILIFVMGTHAMYNLHRQKLTNPLIRTIYFVFFVAYWITCASYALLKTDMFLPVNAHRPWLSCEVAFLCGTQSVFAGKLSFFLICLLRIDQAFHASVMGYPRSFLFCIMMLYAVGICTFNGAFIYDAMGMIEDTPTNLIDLYSSADSSMRVCTTGTSSDYYTYIVGLLFVGDTLFSILVCSLFIYKLHKVNKLTADQRKSRDTMPRSNSVDKQSNKMQALSRLMRKQTILVIISVSTSTLCLGLGAVLYNFSLMIPWDAMVNVFCVWLMFSFGDKVWNRMMRVLCLCPCCACSGDESDFLISMRTMSTRLTARMSSLRMTASGSFETTSPSGKSTPQPSPNLPAIQEKDDDEPDEDEIDLNFENDIKMEDLRPSQLGLPSELNKTQSSSQSRSASSKIELVNNTSVEV